MYIGFELNLLGTSFSDYYESGKRLFDRDKTSIKLELDKYLLPNGSLDGSKMQENWFPQIEANIFISHSHLDEILAISLAGWLHTKFGLKVFIDSCVWGYANTLIKSIDNEYCWNPSRETYNYEKRNNSTSHVHIMLSTALNMMIDKTECIFFLNTPNSITPNDVVTRTKSPWIYSEIATTKLIQKKELNDYRLQRALESFSAGGSVKKCLFVEYILDTSHLIKVSNIDLILWGQNWPHSTAYSPDYKSFALDKLYQVISNK